MKFSRFSLLTGLVLLIASLLSACSGGVIGATSWPNVTVDQSLAFLASHQYVYAINLDNGSQKWRFPTDKPEANIGFYAPPALAPDGQLIVASYSGSGTPARLYSFNQETGTVNWMFDKAKFHFIAGPLVTDKGIFAANADGKLYALDFKGQERWVFSTDQPIWAEPATDGQCNCIFLASMNHKLYSINADTGQQIWSTNDLGGALIASPVFSSNGIIYIGTYGSKMLALNAENGQPAWSFTTSGPVWSKVALDGETLYFGDSKGKFYALNANTGEQLWSIQSDGAIVSPPLVSDGTIYFTTETNTIHAIDTQGNPVWNPGVVMPANVYAPVIPDSDLLLVTTVDPKVLLVALGKNGTQKWAFTIGDK